MGPPSPCRIVACVRVHQARTSSIYVPAAWRRVAIAIATHPPPPPPLAPQYTIGLTYIQGSKKHAKRDAIMLIPTCTIYREITFGLSLPADCARVCISTSPIPPLNSGCERNNERARNRIIHRTDGRTDGRTDAGHVGSSIPSFVRSHSLPRTTSELWRSGGGARARTVEAGGRPGGGFRFVPVPPPLATIPSSRERRVSLVFARLPL